MKDQLLTHAKAIWAWADDFFCPQEFWWQLTHTEGGRKTSIFLTMFLGIPLVIIIAAGVELGQWMAQF